MLKRRIPKFFTSIFFKLMVVILVTIMGINLSIILFFGFIRHHMADNYHPHLIRYVDYLLKDIGEPPSQDRARKITADTDMIISYESPNITWTTADGPIMFPIDRIRIRHKNNCMQFGAYRGTHMVTASHGDGRLTFLLPRQLAVEKKIHRLGFYLLLSITFLMGISYLAIRWVLKPLRWLKLGVDKVAQGELAHRVPERRSDELRDLSASFNTMTQSLQHLIKSKEQLLLDVSHELRTPITRIKIALAMMPDSVNSDTIAEDLKEMEIKITELLETARALNIRESLNYSEIEVVDMIRDTVRRFGAGRPAIHITTTPASVIARLDVVRFRQVLTNILDNGQKYSPDDALPVEVALKVEASEMIIEVRDHGIGIPKEDLDFIFEPFYRADKARTPQKEGFGLGLSLARNIVRAHGGDITVASKVDQGTQVIIRLPLKEKRVKINATG